MPAEVSEGASSIRAFGAQGFFSMRFNRLLTANQCAAHSSAAASAWLSCRLQLLAAALTTAIAGLAVLGHNGPGRGLRGGGIPEPHTSSWDLQPFGPNRNQHSPIFYNWMSFQPSALDASVHAHSAWFQVAAANSGDGSTPWWRFLFSASVGLAGLSLAYALPIVNLLNGLLTSSAETEQEMVSVERIQQYINRIQPEQRHSDVSPISCALTKGGCTRNGLATGRLQHNDDAPHSLSRSDYAKSEGSGSRVAVELQDVCLRYRPHLPLALDNVSFRVRIFFASNLAHQEISPLFYVLNLYSSLQHKFFQIILIAVHVVST